MKVLLDTTVLIDVLRGRLHRWALLAELAEAGHVMGCSVISVAEVHAGMRLGEESRTEDFLANLEVYPVTYSIAGSAGRLRREWALKGVTLSLPDLLIAATALEGGMTLMTDNERDFPVAELKICPLG